MLEYSMKTSSTSPSLREVIATASLTLQCSVPPVASLSPFGVLKATADVVFVLLLLNRNGLREKTRLPTLSTL